ncbi:hypothetical protein BJ322DRAFT_1025804 [Thelephora terrestris]|uniref:Uncharacterized protein n=1 Tax=Thelephora terrestris TaxID=56493 RepID=A0A9P6H1W0_9AGAM|nr:hypothetical protein BJ322DRAFT_1025804 [Thelephora terrestris]
MSRKKSEKLPAPATKNLWMGEAKPRDLTPVAAIGDAEQLGKKLKGSLHLPARRKRRPYSTGKRSKAGIDSPRERPVISALCAPVVITGGTIGASNGIGSGQTLPQSVPTAYNDHEDSGAVRNRADVVILRMTFLDILVSIPPDNVADQRRRNELTANLGASKVTSGAGRESQVAAAC